MISCTAMFRIIRVATILTTLSILSPCAHALTIENVTFADSVTIGSKTVPLHNAALLRYLKFIRAYVAALYLPDDVKPEDVLSDVPKRLELNYLVSIKGPDFGKGAEPTLKLNQTPAELAKLRSRIDRINAIYRDVKPGDRYALTYLPGRGTELALNGTPLTVIEGADFAAAYFGIWLGQASIDDKLKRDLLRGADMKTFLTTVCLAVLAVMLYVTISASLQQDIVSATRQLWPDPWFRATLADAYCGFIFFWLWVTWREQSVVKGALWFVLIMALGNLAMAGYLLLQLRNWGPSDGVADLLLGTHKTSR